MLGLTGTPGTGKKTLAPMVAAALGVQALSINDAVSLAGAKRRRTPVEVEPAQARRAILRRSKGDCLVYGHLLADVLQGRDVGRVVVLRCDPAVLKSRLTARGYPRKKVRENVEAELIGLIAATTRTRFGGDKVAEVDTTRSDAPAAATQTARLLRSAHRAPRRIDWLEAYSSALKLRSLLSDSAATSPRT